ncbi:MAG: hypothetical protein ACM32K_05105 [Syntrophaceae bacterium]
MASLLNANRVLEIGYWENTTGVIARAKPVAIYDFLAIAFVFLSQDVFGLINSLFRRSVYRVAIDGTPEKQTPLPGPRSGV